jgi:hypothetical protein
VVAVQTAHQRRFPANAITLDNYVWAINRFAPVRWLWRFGLWASMWDVCRDLRNNIPVE